jgi:hypothetical protein
VFAKLSTLSHVTLSHERQGIAKEKPAAGWGEEQIMPFSINTVHLSVWSLYIAG